MGYVPIPIYIQSVDLHIQNVDLYIQSVDLNSGCNPRHSLKLLSKGVLTDVTRLAGWPCMSSACIAPSTHFVVLLYIGGGRL